MLFVSINFSLEKDSVVFSAFVNYNIMLCIEISELKVIPSYCIAHPYCARFSRH